MTTKSKTPDKNKLSDIDENISKLFDIKKRLGKGAYGIVWKALDRKTNETLAVKKIFDAFRDETDAQRTFREIIFLKAFRTHPNVIKLHNVFKASNNLDIYLIFEYMESDLHNIIKKGTVLKDIHKRYVMYQLINAIKYIHSGNVIHRDLKPSNVLIDSKCRCKLADFGLARSVSKHPMRKGSDLGSDPVVEPLLTDYVATRWYRAPEILVASKRYTKGIDMWSLGCILGEMIRGKPLFQGSSTINQIEKIVNALPDITEHDIDAVGAGFGSVLLSKQISTDRNTSLEELLANAPEDAVDLVTSLLVLDPLSRLTAKQALCHHYIEKFRNSAQEIELNMDILPPFRDDIRLTVPEYRSKLYEIVQVPGERHNNSRNVANGKNAIIKQRDHKRELGEHPDLIKKSSKIRQHNSMDYTEKVIHKDPYIIKTEKVEKDTQLKSNGLKIHKKTASPVSKQKLHRSSKLQPATEQTEVMPASEKVNGFQAKGKVNYKNTDQAEDALKIMYPLEKRHSIDCGYTISLPVASRPSPKTTTNNHNNSTPCSRKVDSADKLLPSFSLLHKMEGVSHNRGVVRDIPIDQHDRLIRSTPLVVLDKKQSIVRNSKSDIISTPTRDRVCYEKRLRKLEEEIEKYKKEVKSFCKESSRYSNHSEAFKPTVTKGTSLPNTQKIRQNGVVKNVSLPTVISNGHASHNVPKKNPYYQLLSKGNREFGKSEFELPYSTGGSGDHIGRVGPEKLLNGGGDYRIKPDSNQRFRPVSKFI